MMLEQNPMLIRIQTAIQIRKQIQKQNQIAKQKWTVRIWKADNFAGYVQQVVRIKTIQQK